MTEQHQEPSMAAQQLMSAGRKVAAIKQVRQDQNLDLKAAKELVEDYMARHPERFPQVESASSGSRFLFYGAILLALALTYRHFFAS